MTLKTLEVGKYCSFYFCGWRYGVVIAIPVKGYHKGEARVEVPIDLPGKDPVTGQPIIKQRPRYWVSINDVNEIGDTVYHGPLLAEVVEERAEAKKAEQAATDKKRARMSAKLFRRGAA